MRLLVTGGCGFLGSHFIRAWLAAHSDDTVINVDRMTYAGAHENLQEALENPHYHHVRLDVADESGLNALWTEPFGLIVHFAAETHVDRSLENAAQFVKTNVLGTQALLSSVAQHEETEPVVIIVSSDEVYGPTPKGAIFGTGEALRPTSPYAASKAAADWLALSYAKTYGLDVTIVRSVNVYGPRQYPEKLIPLFVTRTLSGEPLPLYGHGRQKRCWLYIDDFVAGMMALLSDHPTRRDKLVWHLGSRDELENRAIADMICSLCAADQSLIQSVADRPGHDPRYALDYTHTARAFAWEPRVPFTVGLAQTVDWIRDHLDWCHERTGWTPAFLRES
ncbi:MAG TPA: GDP-mannose 4,6-dehydratase [candidate division Zixibacteria bacterium]|jgi:dTDP-glucose 4,6-dehydratase